MATTICTILCGEQAEEAPARHRQHCVHGESRRRPGEHPDRPVPGAQHQGRQPGVVRQLNYGDRSENDRGNEQALTRGHLRPQVNAVALAPGLQGGYI
jgi:hypothetical protein